MMNVNDAGTLGEGMSKKGNIDAIRVPKVDAMGRLEDNGGLYEDNPVTVYTEKVVTVGPGVHTCSTPATHVITHVEGYKIGS